jgi:hypothetical protein
MATIPQLTADLLLHTDTRSRPTLMLRFTVPSVALKNARTESQARVCIFSRRSVRDADGSVNIAELIDAYLNGPRTLSNDKLSFLIVSESLNSSLPVSRDASPTVEFRAEAETDINNGVAEYNILVCKAHFISDGLANHRFANEFFCLLGGGQTLAELHGVLKSEIEMLHQQVRRRLLHNLATCALKIFTEGLTAAAGNGNTSPWV